MIIISYPAATHKAKNTKKRLLDFSKSPVITGRDEKIRTSDPLNPIQVRYQTALHPDPNLY